ncbi:Mediator of RNA polymerase II transcription subunit 24 [Lamellibrachia satsuma]|nr:Mediator of RNA polymerase II transcription subunit 24 [Lamellibrachia satsuma]
MAGQNGAAIKSQLLRAWRERWSDLQWSVNVKKVIPPGYTADSCQLPDLLLQQALVGSSPNARVLSYFKHAVSSQMVTYTAAMSSVMQCEDTDKRHCMCALMEVLDDFVTRVSCAGCSEDSNMLARTMLRLLKWLYLLLTTCMQKLVESKQGHEALELSDRICSVLQKLVCDRANTALLFIARQDEPDVFSDIEQLELTLRTMWLSRVASSGLPNERRLRLEKSVSCVAKIQKVQAEAQPLLDVSFHPLNISINVLLNIEAVLNPTSAIEPLVEHLLIIERMQGLQRADLYCELFRSCLMGMIDACGGQDELKWAAFTFIKLPQMLVKLTCDIPEHLECSGVYLPQMLVKLTCDNPEHLERGVEKLISYGPLLDLVDTKYNCDCLHFLLHELCNKKKYVLLVDVQCRKLLNQRQTESQRQKQSDQPTTQQRSPSLILRAELTVTTILKTLDSDYSKNEEGLLGVLCHILSVKSLELILSAAAATGKLRNFATKLIKFNEFAKQMIGESGRAAQTRAMLFDISFLMLCHVTQMYGTQATCSDPQYANAFFTQWALQCLPANGRYKSLQVLPPGDQSKVDALLAQFNPGGELKTCPVKWNEVCHNSPYAVREVLYAWEHGVLTADSVKLILDNVKSKMCSLPVVVSIWLCGYISTVDSDSRAKPLLMLQHINTPAPHDPGNQYYTERSFLMQMVLTNLIRDILPQGSPPVHMTSAISSTTPAYTLLMTAFRGVQPKGCIDIKTTLQFQQLLKLGGANWCCEHLVREVLSYSGVQDLNNGIAFLFSLFLIDLDSLTLSLLRSTIPRLIQMDSSQLHLLTDPRGSALAKLCVMCTVALLKMNEMQKDGTAGHRGKKRSRTDASQEDENEDGDEQPAKMRKLPLPDDSMAALPADSFNLGELLVPGETTTPASNAKDPLTKALVDLFQLFSCVLSSREASPRTGFVLAFIQNIVKAGAASTILQSMPPGMVLQLRRCMPAEFTSDILISMCDLSTPRSRKIATKVISQNAKYQRQLNSTLWSEAGVASPGRKPGQECTRPSHQDPSLGLTDGIQRNAKHEVWHQLGYRSCRKSDNVITRPSSGLDSGFV